MKILMGIGDIHLRDKVFYKKGLNSFLEWFDSKIPDAKKDCTEIVLTGDVFEKISLLPETSAMAVKFFNVLCKKASTVYTILGNHDYGLTQYHVKNTAPFLKKLNVQVIENPGVVETNLGFKLLCLPWGYNLSYTKINNFIKENNDQSFDACVSHWEIESLFGSASIDLSEVKTKVFYCGHIHSHLADSRYLGSILPNNVSEVKDEDFSILRMLVQKDDNSYISKDLNIPSFISIQTIHIQSLLDLEKIPTTQDENVFYKIKYNPALALNNIENKLNLMGLQVYSIEPESQEKENISDLLQNNLLNSKEVYVPKTHKDLLQKYAKQFDISEKEFAMAQKFIEEVENQY